MRKRGNTRDVERLKERLRELSYLGSALGVLHWDQEVSMPKKGADARAATISLLSGILHGRFLEIDKDGLLTAQKKRLDDGKLSGADAAVVRETWRSFERARKFSESFVKEMAELTSRSQVEWARAREAKDFSRFQPYLERIVAKKREEARIIGYTDTPYDALLDEYEPEQTSAELERLFHDLKAFLVPFIARLRTSKHAPKPLALRPHYPIEAQTAFMTKVAEAMGYNLDAGRIDVSAHPFTLSVHPHDVRFTTKYYPENPVESVFPTLHEGGHALYDQGLPHEHFGTPLADPISLGMHESQSRLWENMVGRSLPFWKHWYPKLKRTFGEPFTDTPLAEFYRSINAVRPTLVRIDADEVTYNLHIIIRYELEKALIEGTIEVRDLPALWNDRYREYLGISAREASKGVLQDIHWSMGAFGYFPTYALGNLYSAQFWNAAKNDIPDLEKRIAKGDLKTLREWLQKSIHRHGKYFSAEDLCLNVTGERLNPMHFERYLKEKYCSLYKL